MRLSVGRSILLSLLVSLLLLGAFTIVSQEYRTTTQSHLAHPVRAAIAVAPMGETLHESSQQAFGRTR
jgi:hypothetical protein